MTEEAGMDGAFGLQRPLVAGRHPDQHRPEEEGEIYGLRRRHRFYL